ncbi:MAG: GNAT family N-acetyltransferase [Parachlamydia sp.]|nr:GNAT family N-acetyltransferase [Parachlamydia sp.]
MDITLHKQEFKEARTVEEIRRCYPVMRHLPQSHISEQDYVEQVQRQMAAGYRLVYLEEGDEVCALAGYRFHEMLGWGKVLYIDDLVTGPAFRKKGYGTKLLEWLLEIAREAKCNQVHLDSGPHRHEAHRLYVNHDLKIIGYHFALDLNSKPESC